MELIKSFVLNKFVWQCTAIGVVTMFVTKQLMSVASSIRGKYVAKGKTILITGANSGIGLAAAIEFAKRDARVILACRERDRAVKAAYFIRQKTIKGSLVLKQLNLASLESVVHLAKDLLETEEKIDVLINNAGVMGLPYTLTGDGIETTFQVNYLGHFLLTNLLLNLIRKSKNGRIISVSSTLYKSGKIDFDDMNMENGYSSSRAYSQSKLANLLFTNELSKKLESTDITVNSMSPGMVKTNLAQHIIGNSWIKTLLYETIGRLVLKSPEQACETILFCALDPGLKAVTGKFFRNCKLQDLLPNATDFQTSSELWLRSKSIVRAHFPISNII